MVTVCDSAGLEEPHIDALLLPHSLDEGMAERDAVAETETLDDCEGDADAHELADVDGDGCMEPLLWTVRECVSNAVEVELTKGD